MAEPEEQEAPSARAEPGARERPLQTPRQAPACGKGEPVSLTQKLVAAFLFLLAVGGAAVTLIARGASQLPEALVIFVACGFLALRLSGLWKGG